MLRRYVESRVVPLFVGALARRRNVAPPAARRAADLDGLRADITELAARVPVAARLARRATHVRTTATPRRTTCSCRATAPDELVVIDWAMGTTAPAGEELGQLLIGGAHDGDLDVADLVALRDVVVPAYTAGLAAEGLDVQPTVTCAWRWTRRSRCAARSRRCRSSARRAGDRRARRARSRAASELTRHLVDVGLTLDAVAA